MTPKKSQKSESEKSEKSKKNVPQREWDEQPGERNPDPVIQKIEREEEDPNKKI